MRVGWRNSILIHCASEHASQSSFAPRSRSRIYVPVTQWPDICDEIRAGIHAWIVLVVFYLDNGLVHYSHQVHQQCILKKWQKMIYRQTSNLIYTLAGNQIVDDHSDVVGASPVGAALNTSSFSTEHLASVDWATTTARQDDKHLRFGIWCALY